MTSLQHPAARADTAATLPIEVVLDLSRLLSRTHHATPTGVDRVEMAYARGLSRLIPDRLAYAAVQPSGLYGRLDPHAVRDFLDATERHWEENDLDKWQRLVRAARILLALRPGPVRPLAPGWRRIYLQASPHHLDRRHRVARILRREQARFVCLVHDLIPIEYPEYVRADGAARHRARIATMAALCDGIVTNSEATRRSLQRHLDEAGRAPLVRVAHLGTAAYARPPAIAGASPYFVCIGTIEPRKNHLLLLNIWRRMVEERGPAATPRLVLIGRRGWENEQVIDMLERCGALAYRVEEHNMMSDERVSGLLANARALLLPSFAEGYGMPVTEALTLAVPVICSDLPSLREAGGDVPEFLDPLDGPAWIDAVRDYADAGSGRRARQVERMANWRAPTWAEHLEVVLQMASTVAQ